MILAAFLLAQAAAGAVPVPALPCTTDAVLPPVLAFWKQPATGTTLPLFRPIVLATAEASTPGTRPGRTAAATFAVEKAGAYTVALGGPGWIDVVPAAGGVPLVSIAHGHGPACTTIAKLVAFQLAPGAYRISLNGLQAATIKLALVPGSPDANHGQ